MFDLIFGFGANRQAREELAAENRRCRVDAKKEQIKTRRVNRQGFDRALTDLLFGPRS